VLFIVISYIEGGLGWSPASSSEAGRAYLEEGGYRGEDASELRLGRMSSVLVGGCNPIVSGRDSKTLAPSMVKLPRSYLDRLEINHVRRAVRVQQRKGQKI